MLGALIKLWRKENRMGVREAAKLIGVSAATLSRVENNKAMAQAQMMRVLCWLLEPRP